MQEHIHQRFKNIGFTFGLIYLPMWIIFIFSHIIPGNFTELFLGIRPITFSFNQIFAILGSWIPHASYTHIINNSIVLFGLLLSITCIERKPVRLTAILIAFSGFLTWLLGSTNSLHIGASGLVFAVFGYICSSLVVSKKWLYLLPIIFFMLYYGLSYFTSMFSGLIPSQYVSFAAHFGGLIAGIITGIFYERVKKV